MDFPQIRVEFLKAVTDLIVDSSILAELGIIMDETHVYWGLHSGSERIDLGVGGGGNSYKLFT